MSPMKLLKKTIQNDPEYAYSWFANLACCVRDADGDANEAARLFMKLAFDVDAPATDQGYYVSHADKMSAGEDWRTVCEKVTHDWIYTPNVEQIRLLQSFPKFFAYCMRDRDYDYSRHTNATLDIMQNVTEAVEKGENRYVIINMPPRHGKTDICGRTFPAWHLSRNPTHGMILASYGAQLSGDISCMARDTMAQSYKNGISPYTPSTAALAGGRWGLDGQPGGLFPVGMGGAVGSRIADIIIIDDYIKNREEAESVVVRDRLWDAFQTGLMPRRSPTGHAVVIIASRWHEDDLVGRIHKKMAENPNYPQFTTYTFPAQDTHTGKFLSPKRFGSEFYKSVQQEISPNAWASLYQQVPQEPVDG